MRGRGGGVSKVRTGKPMNMLKALGTMEKVPSNLPHPHKNLGAYLHPKKLKKR